MSAPLTSASPWDDALRAALLFAVDPLGTGGLVVRALPGPVRERWLELLRAALPEPASLRRVPLHVDDDRLLGGLDLAATLHSRRPVASRGILAESDGGAILLGMAERVAPATAARLVQVLDAGEVVLEREGLARRTPTRFGVVALDEGLGDDETVPAALAERLAFHLDLAAVAPGEARAAVPRPETLAAARERLETVEAGDPVVEALCEAAMALGIATLRAPGLALRVARAAAALDGRSQVSREDAALAARLVLAPRARALPETAEAPSPPPEPPESERAEDESCADPEPSPDDGDRAPDASLAESVREAAVAALPAALLEQLRAADGPRRGPLAAGRSGAQRSSTRRGRPMGARRALPRAGARLDLVATLRAAAPWQRLRRAEAAAARRDARRRADATAQAAQAARVEVRRDDLHVRRHRQRSETTVIFAVDASGSTALQRLGEAKGAVERLLADCYVRRDRVALVAFRGSAAEVLLPPTRSLLRAKRALAGLPGGGGTPLAAGIEAAAALARGVLRQGGTPLLVVLTDGRANVARDGSPGRDGAERDALTAARSCRAEARGALLIDTSPRPRPLAERLADAMGARYLALPHADSETLCHAVLQAATPSAATGARASGP